MKITNLQLRRIIREETRMLIEQKETPQDLYDRMVFLRNEHIGEFQLLDKLGDAGYKEVISIRNDIVSREDLEDYDKYRELYRQIGPAQYNISTGGHDPTNKYGLFAQTVRNLFDDRHKEKSLDELMKLKSEHYHLSGQFETVDASDGSDSAYGRKRTNIIHKSTGDVVSSTIDSKGSLGT